MSVGCPPARRCGAYRPKFLHASPARVRAAVADLLDFPATSFPLIARRRTPPAAACVRGCQSFVGVVSPQFFTPSRSFAAPRGVRDDRAHGGRDVRCSERRRSASSRCAPRSRPSQRRRFPANESLVRCVFIIMRRVLGLLSVAHLAGHGMRPLRRPATIFRRRPGGRCLSLSAC